MASCIHGTKTVPDTYYSQTCHDEPGNAGGLSEGLALRSHTPQCCPSLCPVERHSPSAGDRNAALGSRPVCHVFHLSLGKEDRVGPESPRQFSGPSEACLTRPCLRESSLGACFCPLFKTIETRRAGNQRTRDSTETQERFLNTHRGE